MNLHAGGAGVERRQSNAFDNVYAEVLRPAAQASVEHLVGDHMGEWFAGRHFPVECQENRANGI